MLLIGLGHKGRQGKDTFAQAVHSKYASVRDIRCVSFADPLRKEIMDAALVSFHARGGDTSAYTPEAGLQFLCEDSGVPWDDDPLVDEYYPHGKQVALLQWWGTEFRRTLDPDYWIKQFRLVYELAKAEGCDALIVRDMRFENEYDVIGELGGVRIKMSRIGYTPTTPQHISENALDNHPFDYHLGIQDGNAAIVRRMSLTLFDCLYEAATLRRCVGELNNLMDGIMAHLARTV